MLPSTVLLTERSLKRKSVMKAQSQTLILLCGISPFRRQWKAQEPSQRRPIIVTQRIPSFIYHFRKRLDALTQPFMSVAETNGAQLADRRDNFSTSLRD